ncbi:hypothetical protein LOTGIDRAFT_236952 [Lottia gigantea]|uniref:Vitellogenin domain-containing protein n=1 Tax=Lottia gigantea TaxID=225164 RepID=V3ZES3_LOTGI|nr:hypothetical protein LOTGIDRAFT_236952 [Lottia gigantea]ESO82597.1 hypothetical protein LOTGIDRAFT_236952 [Lottia gigantea]
MYSNLKVSYINVGETAHGQEIFLRVRTFSFSGANSPHMVGHDLDLNKWFSFVINEHGEIQDVFYDKNEEDEIVAIKKGMAAMFAGKLHDEDENLMEKTPEGWRYHVQEVGHEGQHNATYNVEPHSDGKKFTKTKNEHPLAHAKAQYTKTLYFNSELGTIHTVHVDEKFSAMKQTVPGYEPFEGQRPTKPSNDFSDIEYPEMKAMGKGKLEFLSQHKISDKPSRSSLQTVQDSIHIKTVKAKPIRSHEPEKILEQIRANLTIMRNQPDESATQEMTNCFHHLMTCLNLLDDDNFEKLLSHYLALNPLSRRNEKDRNHILDAAMGTDTERAHDIITEKVLDTNKPDVKLIMRLMVHIISSDEVPSQKLLTRLFELAFEKNKSQAVLHKGDVYHRILLTVGSVSRKLHQSGRSQEAADAISKIEKMIGYHDPYMYRKKRSIMKEEQILAEDSLKVNLLGALGNARLDQSYEYIVSHINTTNCQWVKRAGITALRGYHHDHAANLMLNTAKYDGDDTVRYEALLQYQAHPRAKKLTPYIPPVARNSSYNESSIYFNPWDLDSQEASIHSRHRRSFIDEGFTFILQSPSVDFKKMLGSTKIGASFGVLMKNLLDLKISALSGHAIVDVHDEAYARVHLGVVGVNLDFFLARVCFKGNAEYNLNLLQEFGIDNLKDLVKLYDKIKNEVVGEIKKGIDLFKKIIRGDISIGQILEEFKQALEQLPEKVVKLGKRAIEIMKRLGEIDESELPPFIRSIRKLVTKVVTIYNDVRKDVMGFYNKLLETITIVIPRAGKQIYAAIKAIIEAFKDFKNDPKKAISTVGGNVLNVGLEVKNLIDAVNKTKDACFFLKKEKPYWFNLKKQYQEIKDLTKQVKIDMTSGSRNWIQQKFVGKDPVAELTNGKYSMAELRQEVIDELKSILDDLLEPFDGIRNLGGEFFERFMGVFKLVDTIKTSYNTLKEGYRTARSLIDRVFGPKCHKDFPRKYRIKGGGCDGSGFYVSELKKGGVAEYPIDGVDVVASRGSKLVAPFPGNIRRSTRSNEVIIATTGGSLKDTEIIITNVEPNSTIPSENDVPLQVHAGQIIGKVTSTPCSAVDFIHFAMRKTTDGGIIDPTRYLEARVPNLPKWVQECDDYRLIWKFDLIAEGSILGPNGKENVTETPERSGPTINQPINLDDQDDPAKVLDGGLFGDDTMFGKASSPAKKSEIDEKTAKTKDKGLANLFKRPAAFLQKFSIRKLKMGAILDLLDILGLDESKAAMAEVILKIKEIIDNKPCFNPYQMTDDQLRTELTERGLSAEGSTKTMIQKLTAPNKKCAAMSLNMPTDRMFCTFDQHCLGIECCAHLKVFMFLKTYKIFARFDPCDLMFVFGIKDVFEKKIGPFGGLYGNQELVVKPGVKIDLLGGMELVITVIIEKTDSVALGTLGVTFCSIEDEDNCLPSLNILDETILPLPVCAPDGSFTWPDVNWKEYYSRDAIKKRLKESAKKLAEEGIEYGIKEGLKELGIPEELLEETPPCQRPEILTDTLLKNQLSELGLVTTGTLQQLRDRLSNSHKTCTILDKTLTLPTIKNEKLKKLIYLRISQNCLHLQACIDVKIRSKLFNFTKAFNAYIELDACNFLLHVGFETYKHSIVLIGYEWGKEEELPLGKAINLKFKIDKDSNKKVFIVDFGVLINLGDEESSIDSKMLEGMEIPIPICNENFTLPGGGSIADFAKEMGGKLSEAAVEVIFQKLGLNKIFDEGTCNVPPSPTDCPWNIDVEKYLPAKVKDKVTCGMPDDCFGVNCCVDFQFKIPFIDDPVVKSVFIYAKFDPCDFRLDVGFGKYKHSEKLLTYQWGTPTKLKIGSGDPAPITLTLTINKYTQGFILDLSVLACIPIDGSMFCFPEEGLDLMKDVRIPACDARALANLTDIDFSLEGYFKEIGDQAGQKLAKSAAQFLLDKFGITPFLLDERCDVKREPYSSSIDGWRNDCPKPIKKLPKLPKGLICHIGDTCTKIDCCFDVAFLDMSFHAFLNLDMCDYFLEASIEKKHIKYSLFNDEYNLDTGITGEVKISDFFVVTFGVRKVDKKFLLDLSIKVCFEKDKCQENYPILTGTEVPQFICDLNAKLDFNLKNFSIADWAKEKGMDIADGLAKKAVQVFLEQTGIAEKMLDPPCKRDSLQYQPALPSNWKNDCPKITTLPELKAPANCYIPDYCTGIDCCLESDLLGISLNAHLNIDTCNYVIEGAIEKIGFKIVILEYDWGTEEEEKLSEFVFIKFKIDRLLEQKMFIVDLSIKMCFKGADSCEIDLPVLQQSRIPMPLCNMEMGFKIKDFSLKNWLEERGGDLTAILANQLMDQLGITKYLKDTPCSFVQEPFKTASVNDGWNKACPLNMTLPALNDRMACYIPEYCTGITCCVDVREIRRTFQAHLFIDTCNYIFSVGIEKIVYNVTLVDYVWGTEESIDIGGIFQLKFRIEDLPGEKQYLVNLKMSACFTAGEKCDLEIPVFTDMRVPKLLCDWDATLALKDFKLDEWLAEQGGQLTDTIIDKLLEKFGISAYLTSPMCDRDGSIYAPAVQGWKKDCQLNMNLPALPSDLSCQVPDFCTGIDCCLQVPFLKRSFRAVASINMCTNVLTLSIEKIKLQKSLINYNWGQPDSFNLRGVIRVDYVIYDLAGDKQYLLGLNMSVCLSSDKPCQPTVTVLNNVRIPKLFCDWDATTDLKDFSLQKFLEEQKQNLGDALSELTFSRLFEALNISQYLIRPQCNRAGDVYSPANAKGWKYDCPIQTLDFGKLPDYATCRIPDFCTGIDCCVTVPVIGRSFNVKVYLNACDYTLTVSLENLVFKKTLLNYQWGTREQFNINGVVGIEFVIDNLEGARQYLISVSATFCFDSTTACLTVPILNNARVPKILCDWESDYSLKDFSLSTWLEEQGMAAANELSSIVLARLFNELNIAQYLKDPQCDTTTGVYTGAVGGWKNECPLITNLPPLSNGLTCYIPDTCTGIQCCAPVPILKRSFEAFIYLDSCNFKFRVGVEKYEFSRNLINYEWGTKESLSMQKLVTAQFTIDDLNSEKKFLVNLNISICLEKDKPCFLSVPVLTNTKIPKLVCDWDSTLALKDFSLSDWLENQQAAGIQSLTSALRAKLYEELGIAMYIKSPPCLKSSSVFSPATSKGWKNECPISEVDSLLPQLPDNFRCHVGSRCTNIDCCIDVGFLDTSIYTLVDVNMCDYTLTLTIENLSYEHKLFDYTWGQPSHFYLKGVVRVDYVLSKIDAEKSIEVSVKISVCLAENDCLFEQQILDKKRIPQPLCNYKESLELSSFSLKHFKLREQLPSAAQIADIFLTKLLEETGLADYLQQPGCDRESAPYIPADSKNWRKECTKSITLPSLPDSTRCHWSADCSTIDCCIYVGLIKRTVNLKVEVDVCNLELTLKLGKMEYVISLFDYEWDKEDVFHISGRVRLYYKLVNLPAENKIKTDLNIKVCFEDDSCLLDVPILQQVDISYSPCDITKPQAFKGLTFDFWSFKSCQLKTPPSSCPVTLPAAISNICHLADNCQGISCCMGVDLKYLGQYSLAASFKLDHCQNKLTYSLENKQWEKTLLPIATDTNITEKIGEAIDISYVIKDVGSAYVVSVDIKLCALNTYQNIPYCKFWSLLDEESFVKPGCTKRRKRRSVIKVTTEDQYEATLKDLIGRDATNKEIQDFMNEVKNDADTKIETNLFPDWEDGGQANTIRSALKSMGSTNPSTILYRSDNGKVTVGMEGSEEVFKILNTMSGVIDDVEQAFVVGKGLTGAGLKLLGAKLANMTIGEIMTLVDTKNIDPEKALELVKQIRNLASALYSEVLDAVLSGQAADTFKSLDFTLQGDFSFPKQNVVLFEYSIYFLLAGIVPMNFRFGAGCTYGMQIIVGGKIMKMVAFGGATPYGAVLTFGELNVGFILYGGLRLEGYIMTTSFPTRAEIGFSKFPLDIGLTMDLELVPLRLRLLAIVTLRVKIGFIKFTKTLFKATLWKYSTPTIRKRLIDFGKVEEDTSPPLFAEYTDTKSGRRKRAAGLPINTATRHCSVRQLKGRDHTEPAIEISIRAEDDKSQVKLFLTAGSKPGLADALSETQLGGPSSIITTKLKQHGRPIYFTVVGRNSGGGSATVTCSLPTYDVSLPGGRFTTEFVTSSNPRVLKASVVVFEDSDLEYSSVGVGLGRGIYGDEMEHWNPIDLKVQNNKAYDAAADTHGYEAEAHFTTSKLGRLIAPVAQEFNGINYYQACLKKCLELPESKCLSVNYELTGHCELLEAIEGHDYKISTSGKYLHMERLGVGLAYEFAYSDKQLQHNKLYYFNFDLKNHLGFRNIISTKGILIDTTTPTPGEGLFNATTDELELVTCRKVIPKDRTDWAARCIDQSTLVKNHRTMIDGEGSNTVFNGHTPLLDKKYFRANRYMSGNWDGIHDKETGIHGYSFAAGHSICEETLDEHKDPHAHLYDESEWTHTGIIKRDENDPIPDGKYYLTVRALNKVEYGGPLVTSFCHSTPYVIDNSVPFVHEVFNVRYDEESEDLSAEYNATDPESDVREVDICLGRTTKDCSIKDWERYPHSGEVIHNTELPGGIPVWVKIKAWNNVNISALRSADHPLILDITPPIAGKVYDGPLYKHDLMYTKDSNKICANWVDFYDPESGLSYFSAYVRASANDMYLTNGTDFDHRTHQACIDLDDGVLEHGKKYYIELWAYNAGHKQLNVSGRSDGVTVDLTIPVTGEVVDGIKPNMEDIEFSAATATISGQWKGQYDPESSIKSYEIQILRAKNISQDFEVLRDWHELDNDTQSIEWHNFHLHHRDNVKLKLRTTNGALGRIVEETDGYVVDLTPPSLIYLNDGGQQTKDIDYQSSKDSISVNYKFIDEESGIDHYKYQVYQLFQGSKHQIYPADGEWIDVKDATTDNVKVTSIALKNGARYSVRMSAVNKANAVATFDTNGFLLDDTPPEMRWLHVGVFNGEIEEDIDGEVLQADKTGIKASWFATDDVSGIKDYSVAVGTTPGGQDILAWKSFSNKRDGYIDGLNLQIKTASSPYYYVSVKAENGAGLESGVITSTPIKVVDEDKAGIVLDGAEGTEGSPSVDIDYQLETGTVTVQFSGYESALHGISRFDWAVGTTAGGEEVQPFMEASLIHKEEADLPGNGIASSGYGQAILPQESGVKYYATVRGISNIGNVLESTSDGFTVDISPPSITVQSLSEVSEKMKLEPGMKIYQAEVDSISADWLVQDLESNVTKMFYSVGTYPDGADIKSAAEVSVFLNGEGSLPVGDAKPTADGKPNIINFWAVNNVGLTGKVSSATLIVDTTPPSEGVVTCPSFIQPHTSMKCSWDGFIDNESPIVEFTFGLGSREGTTDVIAPVSLPGYTTLHLVDNLLGGVTHGKKYFAIVTAKNAVGKTISAVSDSISVDVTPPVVGQVVELRTEYIINVTSDRSTSELNTHSCNSKDDCDKIDAVCQESLTSINVAWSQFTDPETKIVRYEIAVGTTPGGGQVKQFFTASLDKRYMTIKNLALNGLKQVYVTVKATNAAGLSTVATSNGVYISYVSQGKEPLKPIGVWDGDTLDGDINFQTSLDTITARWDVTGDPCPAMKLEWSIVRIDGLVVQNFTEILGSQVAVNDKLSMKNGERYYVLLRVTTSSGYSYILRSNGVTIEQEPLIPGQVNDGDVVGFDLNKIYTQNKASANWGGFGIPLNGDSAPVEIESGNPGVGVTGENKNQEILYYEVALGKDRRFPKTRDNVVPFTNVGLNTSVTFFDLKLLPLTATYYFTVRATSKSLAVAEVTSNGFQAGYNHGVLAASIVMPEYIKNNTVIDIQWNEFQSKVGMMMYYIAISSNNTVTEDQCRQFIEGGDMTEEGRKKVFDIRDVENVGKDTFKQLTDRILEQDHGYYATVIGVDKAGDCNLTTFAFHVDITPPVKGLIKVGPYYGMKMSYAASSESVTVDWKDYIDDESGIKCFRVSLIEQSTCETGATRTTIVKPIEINGNYTAYEFLGLYLQPSRPYIVHLEVENNAGLKIKAETAPVIYDTTKPTGGHVVDGTNFRQDVVWINSLSTVTGSVLYLPSPDGPSCPSRNIKFTDSSWKRFKAEQNYDSKGNRLQLEYRDGNVLTNPDRDNELEIKLARDVKTDTMFTGGYYRDADMVNGGTYEVNLQAADGKGKAVTSIVLWDGPESVIVEYDYTKEVDWTLGVCSCCKVDPNDNECLKVCNCKDFLEARNIVKRSTGANDTNKPDYVKDLTEEQRAELMLEETAGDTGDVQAVQIPSYRSCGIQILAGDAQKLITWCRFKDNLNQPMKAERKLTFDPSASVNNYRLEFNILQEEATGGTWCLNVYVNDDEISELCGIPELSVETKLFLHVWNWKNYLPPLPTKVEDMFELWSTKAIFTDLIMPPESNAICRLGRPFRGGKNAVVKFEAGIGTRVNSDNVVPFREVTRPCIPCQTPCDRFECLPPCNSQKVTQHNLKLNNLELNATEIVNGTEKAIHYHFTVKAVLGSGMSVISSSNGFYVDVTPPEVFEETFLYIDVYQGNFTPVSYQASNDTIRSIFLCEDTESLIVEYQWAIGTTPGGLDIQEYVSTGINPSGTNRNLLGILEDNSTYYVSVKCRNGAGLETVYNEQKGVTVLLNAPDIADINTNITGAEPFTEKVSPPTAMKSTDPSSIGCSWTVSADPSIREYDFGVGSTVDPCDDIFPFTWVGYNVSGEVAIKDGWLQINGEKVEPIGAYNPNQTDTNDTSTATTGYKMEPGRTLFLCMRMCNEARRCTVRNVGTSIIVDANSKMATSTNGESVEVSLGSSTGRKKRAVTDVVIKTPPGLQPGQTIMETELTTVQLEADYRSDASTEFISYITNPATTLTQSRYLHRLLLNRLNPNAGDKSFSVTSVGNLPMPGPLEFTIKYNPATTDADKQPMLIHWNPAKSIWELSKRTCKNEANTEIVNETTGEIKIKVCDTWSSDETVTTRTKRAVGKDAYFKRDTQFMVTDVLRKIPNTPPQLAPDVPRQFTMIEDEGTIVYQLKVVDPEGDEVVYSFGSTPSASLGSVNLTAKGLLMYLPCKDCSGEIEVPVKITEVQSEEIPPEETEETLKIVVTEANDAPTVFALKKDKSLLLSDPTETVVLLMEQNRLGLNDSHQYSWTFGVYDVDTSDKLRLFIDRPKNGSLTISPGYENTPSCGIEAKESSLPCNRMSLPHPVNQMKWLYYTMTYEPEEGVSGYDDIRMFITDDAGTSSDVVSIRMAMMMMPCLNGGTCQPKSSDATYTCENYRRAESFDDHYSCKCADGWVGSRCQDDYDECTSSPCSWPYVCYNYENRYECACSQDEPNCDGLVGWMIALIVIGVLLMMAIIALICYICMVRRGRVKWSKFFNRYGSNNSNHSSDDDKKQITFDNNAYNLDNEEEYPRSRSGSSQMVMFNRRYQYDGLNGPMREQELIGVPSMNSSPASSGINGNGRKASSSQGSHFGPSTFEMSRSSPKGERLPQVRLVTPPREQFEVQTPYKETVPYPDYID